MESRCHAGKTILYDTIGLLGWSSSVVTHRIATLTDDLLVEDWDKKVAKAKGVLSAQPAPSKWHLPWSNSDKDPKPKLGPVPKIISEKECIGK